jgi:hypothetical protein
MVAKNCIAARISPHRSNGAMQLPGGTVQLSACSTSAGQTNEELAHGEPEEADEADKEHGKAETEAGDDANEAGDEDNNVRLHV